MQIKSKFPVLGESVQEAVLAQWFKKMATGVQRRPLFVMETDKVTLEVPRLRVAAYQSARRRNRTHRSGGGGHRCSGRSGGNTVPKPPKQRRSTTINDKIRGLTNRNPHHLPARSLEPVAAEAPVTRGPSAGGREKRRHCRSVGSGPGGRITKGDVLLHLEQAGAVSPPRPRPDPTVAPPDGRPGVPPQTHEPHPPTHRRPAPGSQAEHGHADHLQ